MYPTTLRLFVDCILDTYPRPTPWNSAYAQARPSVESYVRSRLQPHYHRTWVAVEDGDFRWFLHLLADLVAWELCDLVSTTKGGYHFDAVSTLIRRAGLEWIDPNLAERRFCELFDQFGRTASRFFDEVVNLFNIGINIPA